ncbi:MAG: TolC family protein [Bacteroidetes bacterium]|nr:TolC family protein [Bacteroidota bacterium]
MKTKRKTITLGLLIIVAALFTSLQTKAADSLRVTLLQADSMFLATNYQLLAASMNIEAQKAQIIQAELYPNPLFTADFNAYDLENNKPFHVGSTGQMGFQLEQLIILGGKRQSEIDLAKTNASIAELEFRDLIRQLKFQIHSNLHSLNHQEVLLNKYNNQLRLLDTILNSFQAQVSAGNIPLKDVVRLKVEYLNLNNDRAELLKQMYDERAKIQTILRTNKIIVPIIGVIDVASFKIFDIEELNQIALSNRSDYLISQQNKTLAEQNLIYQKNLAIPDVNLIASYDQRGGAFRNQFNIGFAVPLPFWNQNQGNIQAASHKIKQAEYTDLDIKNSILADVQNSYSLFNQAVVEYKKAMALYNSDFEITLKGMSDNFQKRNVSLLEFVDFFESYNSAEAEIARIKTQLAVSAEQLNFSIGKDIY